MINDYDEFCRLIKESYPDTAESKGGVLSLTIDSISMSVVPVPSDPRAVIFRFRVIDLHEIRRAKGFVIAALKANFFWSGTQGATLSVGKDNVLYLTERRYLQEFVNADDLERCLDEYAYSVNDWRMRGQSYA